MNVLTYHVACSLESSPEGIVSINLCTLQNLKLVAKSNASKQSTRCIVNILLSFFGSLDMFSLMTIYNFYLKLFLLDNFMIRSHGMNKK